MAEEKVGLIGKISVVSDSGDNFTSFKFELGYKPIKSEMRNRIFIPLSTEHLESIKGYLASNPEAAEEQRAMLNVNIRNSAIPALHIRTIWWQKFFPFGGGRLTRPQPKAWPGNKGIGSLVHYGITEYFAQRKKYRGFYIRHDPEMERERGNQLRKMGINPSERYDLQEYRAKVRAHVEKLFGKKVKVYVK